MYKTSQRIQLLLTRPGQAMSGPWTKTTFMSFVRIFEESGFLTLSDAESRSERIPSKRIDAWREKSMFLRDLSVCQSVCLSYGH